jgi:hypothetical protein
VKESIAKNEKGHIAAFECENVIAILSNYFK